MASSLFKGYSSIGKSKPFTQMTDHELIKRDILNQFNTRLGERVMRPTFGSRLWDYIFEPFDQLTKDAIIDDANNVVRSDPRVQIVSTTVQEFEHGIIISFQLTYVPFNTVDSFILGFDRRNTTAQEISL